MSVERRFVPCDNQAIGIEQRDDGSKVIVGYGAVFYRTEDSGTEYELWDNVFERISPTAFDRAIKESHDVRGLFNHDASNLLGRVSSKTLRLSTDKTGLRYEIDVDMDDPDHQRVVRKIERGDLTGSSFAFKPTMTRWEDQDDQEVRWIDDVDLFDTGPVTYPAYTSATTGLRSDHGRDEVETEYRYWQDSKERSKTVNKTFEQVQANFMTFADSVTDLEDTRCEALVTGLGDYRLWGDQPFAWDDLTYFVRSPLYTMPLIVDPEDEKRDEIEEGEEDVTEEDEQRSEADETPADEDVKPQDDEQRSDPEDEDDEDDDDQEDVERLAYRKRLLKVAAW